ncbi:putative nuclease HARBI1 [Rana temporaria]|uniref:putative nuclease HARBI1 n=1 Tax=Rana temporaria TaxID=8407 RepID=UPI001AAD6CBC|nr:putative nuclease HARBI1 [Rana temporaria]
MAEVENVLAVAICLVQQAILNELMEEQAAGIATPRIRQPRLLMPRALIEGMRDSDVRTRFRLSRGAIYYLYGLLEDKLQPTTARSQAVPGMVKLLATLYILGHGSFQTTSGLILGISQPTVSRVFMQVINAILDLVPQFIHWPQTEDEWTDVMVAFYQRGGFPQILGAIDCTHVAIRPPRRCEVDFRNRKQYHSLNVQVVCDARQRIMSARTGFPGSCHDAFMLRQSALYQKFKSSQMPSGWLIGDAGYPQLAWLMAPVRYPQSQAEHIYNRAHKKSRAIVESTFGLLKSRFMCLAKPGGELLYSPWKCARIILACCVLHNICLARNESWDTSEEREPEVHQPAVARRENTQAGLVTRAKLIRRYFTTE